MSVKCNCGHVLCLHSEVAFYKQGYSGWHLIVKPEHRVDLEGENFSLRPHWNPKKSRFNPNKIFCNGCSADVGNESRVGPAEELLLCFDHKAVQLGSNYVSGSALNLSLLSGTSLVTALLLHICCI